MSRTTAAAAVAAALSLALGTAACSSGNGPSGANSDSITIESWNVLANPELALPETKTAMEAGVQAINNAGGINGHQVNLIFCDTNFNPNTEDSCAQEAVTKHVVAVVGAASYFPDAPNIVAQAGIPFVGARGADPTDFTASTAFPLIGGNYSWGTGEATLMARLHLKSIGVVSEATPTSEQQTSIITEKLKQLGLTVRHVVDAPIGAPDQAATAAAVSAGVDGIIVDAAPNDGVKVLQALNQNGYTGAIATPSTDLTPAFMTAEGPHNSFTQYAIGAVLPPSDVANSAIAKFRQEMKNEDPKMPVDEDALTFWTALILFQKIVTPLHTINASTVLAAMKAAKSINLDGITPPYTVAGNKSPVASAPRFYDPYIIYEKVENQTVKPLTGQFVNPFLIK